MIALDKTTVCDITVTLPTASLPIAVTLEVAARWTGSEWVAVGVKWAELVAWPNVDQGQRYLPHDWSRATGCDWLRWLTELDPQTVKLNYGTRSERTVKWADAFEEAWIDDGNSTEGV